jgi:methylated-DNA-[protein]-cysteine S-methyltransferase
MTTTLVAGTAVATTLSTPAGPLTLASDGEAVTGCWFGDPSALFDRLGLAAPPRSVADLGPLSRAVSSYLEGDLAALDGIPVTQPGPHFRQECWAAMRAVPAGQTISYTQLAERVGRPRAVRAAGSACARNLVAVIVPCHRIVTSRGGLGGYAYGLPAKRWLLAHEAPAAPSAPTAPAALW